MQQQLLCVCFGDSHAADDSIVTAASDSIKSVSNAESNAGNSVVTATGIGRRCIFERFPNSSTSKRDGICVHNQNPQRGAHDTRDLS
jgi:hypothetical protein